MKALTHFLVMCIVVGFGLVGGVRAGDYTVANANELNALIMRLRATQFLQHATFGARDAEVNALASRMAQIGAYPALNEWIDNQFALPVTLHEQTIREMYTAENVSPIDSAVNPIRFRYHSWWHNAITAPDQLRQRMGWALIQLFVVGEIDNFNSIANDRTGQPSWMGMTHYYDMLLTDSFGNYRTLLTDVTRHPVMGVYLSHLRNNKPNLATNVFPDENYAREIMQLFSIGLYELNPDGSLKKNAANQLIPTYDNDKIQTFARLFTGMTYAQSTSLTNGAVNFHEPMMMFEANHDKDAKNVFGATLPAGLAGLVDLNLGLDNLFNHPNVGPFVCRRLIQRLVRSNPSSTYLGRVVAQFNNNGLGVRGDMKAVIKAILLDPEAFDGIAMVKKSPTLLEVRPGLSERTRLQEPIILYAQFLRRYASSGHASGRFLLPSLDGIWGQAPYRSPSVFNFYLPDFQPAGDITNVIPSPNIPNGELVAPEFQLLNSVTGNAVPNRYRADIYNQTTNHFMYTGASGSVNFTINFAFPVETGLAGNSTALVEYLDKALCCGTMSNAARTALITALNQEPTSTTALDKAKGALLSVLTSPAYNIVE